MNILWISDFDTSTFPGGAQLTQELLLNEGDSRHTISRLFYQGIFNRDVNLDLDTYDLVISNTLINLWKHFLQPLKQIKHHIHISHDVCPYLSDENKKLLLTNNLLTCFMSPEHQANHKDYSIVESYILYPPIDNNIFVNNNSERDVDCVWVGLFHPLKGIQQFTDYVQKHPEKKFILVGFGNEEWIKNIKSLRNVHYFKTIRNSLLTPIYNRSVSLYFSPQQDETFGRTVAEAILCGCKIITDGRYQIPSLNLCQREGFAEMSNTLENSARKFWEKIENL